jgi:hypothetical protein
MAAASPFPPGALLHNVVRLEFVKTSIQELLSARIHPTFAAYLSLKRQSIRDGRTSGLRPDWSGFFGTFLRVLDGPYNKPWLRPFWDQQANAGQMWMNRNIAGSFAISSLRAQISPLLEVIDTAQQGRRALYSLRDHHWTLAREHLAGGKRIAAVQLAAFLYRDYAIVTKEPPSLKDLVDVFRHEFGYTSETGGSAGPVEFDHLYIDNSEKMSSSEWFEMIPAEEVRRRG